MKLNSFFDKQIASPRRVSSSPIFVPNEKKEQELLREITVLEAKLKQYEASIIEHDEIKRISSAVQDENKKVTFDLEQSVEQVRLHQSELEELDLLEKSNVAYKEQLIELEGQNKTLNSIIAEAQENSKQLNADIITVSKQNQDYQEKIEEWNLRVHEAEGIVIGLEDDKRLLDEAKRDAEVRCSTAESQFVDMKQTIEQLDSERNFWKVSSQSYEDQMNELGRVEDRLRSWTGQLEDKLGEGQSNSKKDKSKITRLNKTIKEMALAIEDLTDHNNYLIDFNSALKVELSKPKYVSVGSVQGERFPLARENIRTKQLGTGKPTLLKFRPKGEDNDNN